MYSISLKTGSSTLCENFKTTVRNTHKYALCASYWGSGTQQEKDLALPKFIVLSGSKMTKDIFVHNKAILNSYSKPQGKNRTNIIFGIV